jgi:hypothetical protein
MQASTQVTSCYNLLTSVRQLPFNSRSARMSVSQVQRVFIVKHCLLSRSYLTCQNEFRDTFPILLCQTNRQYLVWRTVFVTAETLYRVASNIRKRVIACIAECGGHFKHLIQHCLLFSDFNVTYFLTNRTCIS